MQQRKRINRINLVSLLQNIQMIKQVILLLTFIPLVACKAENLQQKDIRDYINNAKTCEYLAGEAGEQEATEAEKLNKNIDKYCGLAQKQLTALEKKYRSNKHRNYGS